MNHHRRGLSVVVFALIALVLCAGALAQAPVQYPYVPGELLVGVTHQADQAGWVRQAAINVGEILETNARIGVHRVRVRPGMSLEQAAARIAQTPGVRFVEPNYILTTCATPNDPYFASQYGPKKIQADLAWELWSPVAPVVIAIVDTGIDNTHPDLTNKILRNGSTIVGFNALTDTPSDALDDHGHGTHCAGIAAGQINNGVGIAGIAGWDGLAGSDSSFVKLMPVKVLSQWGSGNTTDVAEGITWAADNGANVISLSLGGGGSITLASAVSYAWSRGCIVVAAAGNNSSSTPSYPAAYPESLSVAATDSTDTLCSFSNWGSWVAVAAPGAAILSTAPTYPATAGYPLNYASLNGTSMACPHVAGEAALIWSKSPFLTNADVKALIIGNTDPYTPFSGRTIAGGRVNVFKAMGGTVEPPPPPAPEPPAAPTNLSATAGTNYITLKWTQSSSPNVVQNKVYRSTSSSSGFTCIATLNATTTYTNSGLPRRTRYYYKVTAVNADGLESGFSNTVNARTK
ncbi:MAG: S8 family serine peptidase [Chthonomonadales bacterium]|nr:S8 family serine peptidase [Chthonomonadales bacterium]